jgi:hypothetical protein
MAKAPKNQTTDGPEDDAAKGDDFVPPAEPKLPPKDGRTHKATWAKDKYERGYNIRVIGANAWKMGNRWLPVTRMDESESMEFAMERIWKGVDDDTGKPVALFAAYRKPRQAEDDIPF